MNNPSPNLTPAEQPVMTASARRKITIGLPSGGDSSSSHFPLTPEAANRLVEAGYEVLMQEGAARGIHYDDNRYVANGVTIAERDATLKCDIVICLSVLPAHEIRKMRRGAMLLTLLNVNAISSEEVNMLAERNVTAIAIDCVKDAQGNAPVADILAEINGRAAIVMASSMLTTPHGKGILLGGVVGVVSCEVMIIGSGLAACAAANSAVGLGAMVRMFDNDVYRLRQAMHQLGPMVIGSAMLPQVMRNALRSADVVIVTDTTQPCVIHRDDVELMKQGVLLFDLTTNENNCFVSLQRISAKSEKSHSGRTVITDVDSVVPRSATMALGNALVAMLTEKCDDNDDRLSLLKRNRGIQSGAFVYMGKIVNASVAHRLNMRYVDISLIIQFS